MDPEATPEGASVVSDEWRLDFSKTLEYLEFDLPPRPPPEVDSSGAET
jgi:hypothetical protein